MLVIGQDEAVAQWAVERLEHVGTFGPCAAIGFAKDNELKAAAVFNNLRWPNIEMSLVIEDPRVCTKENISAAFYYPFYIENVSRITALIAKSNKRARRFTEGIGFTNEGRLRKALPNGESLIVYGLTREDYEKTRWNLGEVNG